MEETTDSTVPDILVESNNGSTFYVEAKHSPAQSGQFVLLPNILTKEFDYSCKNTTSSDKFSNQIINYMNHFFEKYKEAGTKGIEINFPNCENVFFDWIIHKYRSSGVKYIITNGYNIIKLENIPMFFNVSATYRVKRSGSSSVGKKKLSTIQHYIENNYSISNIYSESDKLYAIFLCIINVLFLTEQNICFLYVKIFMKFENYLAHLMLMSFLV
mgnify:CR=1 FL=1